MSSGEIRLGGVASGIDTQSLIEEILKPQQDRIVELEEDIALTESKAEIWTDIANQFKSFGNSLAALRSTSSSSIFNQKQASSSDETVFTAIASSTAQAASYPIEVTALAQSHAVATENSWSSSNTLAQGFSFQLNGTVVSFEEGDSLDEVVEAINTASWSSDDVEVVASKIQVGSDSYKLILQGKTASQDITIKASDGSDLSEGSAAYEVLTGTGGAQDPAANLTFLNPDDLSFAAPVQTRQLASIDLFSGENAISVTSTTNQFSSTIPGVTLTVNKVGTANLEVETDTEEIKETLVEFVSDYNELRGMLERTREVKQSEDEQFGPFFSDSLLRRLMSQIRGLTTGAVRLGDTSKWSGDVQVDEVINSNQVKVTGFDLGLAGQTLQAGDEILIDGTRYTLTASSVISVEEEADALEPEIVLEQAVATLSLSPSPSSLQAADSVSVSALTLEQFGIDVDTTSGTGIDGVLKIVDEGALDQAIASNLDQLALLFQRDGDDDADTGIARRLYSWVDQQTKISNSFSSTRAIDNLKLSSLANEAEDLREQIERIEERMAQREQLLTEQFARMEEAMSRAQSVSSSLSSLQGGG